MSLAVFLIVSVLAAVVVVDAGMPSSPAEWLGLSCVVTSFFVAIQSLVISSLARRIEVLERMAGKASGEP